MRPFNAKNQLQFNLKFLAGLFDPGSAAIRLRPPPKRHQIAVLARATLCQALPGPAQRGENSITRVGRGPSGHRSTRRWPKRTMSKIE
jgi:hypothetical protein